LAPLFSYSAPFCELRDRLSRRLRLFSMTHPSPDAARGNARQPVIRLQSVQKSFALPSGEVFDAVQSLSLDIHQGDVFGLIGKSGAGKSTLLRLINLLERPDAGKVSSAGATSPRSRAASCATRARTSA
jgi:D-methionine transport system ATP-binding protein